MKLFKKEQFVSVLASLILFASVPVVFAWTSPQVAPPGGNVDAPINAGMTAQIKQGFFGLYGNAAGMAISKADTSYSLLNNLSLGVKGKIGADLYCNSDGTRCADIDQLIGNSVVNNYSTTTQNGCKFEQTTFDVSIKTAAGNNKAAAQTINLIAGTWTVVGSGKSVKCGGSNCGSHGIHIKVSNKGIMKDGHKTLMLMGSKASVHNWKVPETTFAISQDEKLVATVSQGSMTGNLTLTGPKLVCPTN
ncbi:MAG: hypothetical protein QG568_275 [Patescibacteria group bacterium]|nr:hypothetical protein [Patescibacteria group bacterium]